MAALAARYPDVDFVDVVNEPLHAVPSYAAALGGAGATGYDWVLTAFEMAREHFPGAELHVLQAISPSVNIRGFISF